MSIKINLEVSEKNEATESPWWLIIDPRQMMKPDIHSVASMITGPFFSREAAENHLASRRYAFGEDAVVYCHSGYWANQYKEALREAKKGEDTQTTLVDVINWADSVKGALGTEDQAHKVTKMEAQMAGAILALTNN